MTTVAERPTEAPPSRPSHKKRKIFTAVTGGLFLAIAVTGGVAAHNARNGGPDVNVDGDGKYETVVVNNENRLSVLGGVCLQGSPDGSTFLQIAEPLVVEGTTGVWGIDGSAPNGGLRLIRFAGTAAVCAPGAEQSTPTTADAIVGPGGELPEQLEIHRSEYDPGNYPGVPPLPS